MDNLKAVGAPFLEQDSGVRYDIDSLEPKSTFGYNIEGWELTRDGRQFIESDGTSILRLLHTDTVQWQAYANIRQQDRIAIIRPKTWKVSAHREKLPPTASLTTRPVDLCL